MPERDGGHRFLADPHVGILWGRPSSEVSLQFSLNIVAKEIRPFLSGRRGTDAECCFLYCSTREATTGASLKADRPFLSPRFLAAWGRELVHRSPCNRPVTRGQFDDHVPTVCPSSSTCRGVITEDTCSKSPILLHLRLGTFVSSSRAFRALSWEGRHP